MNVPRAVPPRAWQRMLSGRRLDLLDPSPLDIELSDIAHGLARVARWNGQTRGAHAFSVAQHSVLVAQLVTRHDPDDPKLRLYALLHDAPEYVIGDMISPFKAMIGPAYRAVEDRLARAIHLRFGLAAETPVRFSKVIKRADRTTAHVEAVHFAGFTPAEADALFVAPNDFVFSGDELTPWPPELASKRFTAEVEKLA